MARRLEPGSTPIESAIVAAIERELHAALAARAPRSSHPIAVAAQHRRLVARAARPLRERLEAERRRVHRLAFETALLLAQPEEAERPKFWWERD